MERTLVILKPDALKRKLIGEIIKRFETKNLEITQMKTTRIERDIAEYHYQHVREFPFFNDMIDYIIADRSVIMLIEGENAITTVRELIGKASPNESLPGSIRGDYGINSFKNLIHASDSIDSAEVEIRRFFGELSNNM